MRETLRHREAFDYYSGLLGDRGLREVAQQFNVSLTAVGRWSKAFNWQARVEQRDIENAKRLEKKTDNTIIATKAKYREHIKKRLDDLHREHGSLAAAYNTGIKKLEKGELEIVSMRDLVEVSKALIGIYKEEQAFMKTDLLLIGEADSRVEHTVTLKDILQARAHRTGQGLKDDTSDS